MPMRLSVQATAGILLLLEIAAWGAVLAEAAIEGAVSLMSVTSALLVTALVLAWPFLHGARMRGSRVVQLQACHLCGTLPVRGLPFCIRCGAYPKAAPAKL